MKLSNVASSGSASSERLDSLVSTALEVLLEGGSLSNGLARVLVLESLGVTGIKHTSGTLSGSAGGGRGRCGRRGVGRGRGRRRGVGRGRGSRGRGGSSSVTALEVLLEGRSRSNGLAGVLVHESLGVTGIKHTSGTLSGSAGGGRGRCGRRGVGRGRSGSVGWGRGGGVGRGCRGRTTGSGISRVEEDADRVDDAVVALDISGEVSERTEGLLTDDGVVDEVLAELAAVCDGLSSESVKGH